MVPPKPAASAHPLRRNHHVFSQLQLFSGTPQVQARPDQLGSGGRQGWPLLCREPPPGIGLSVAASEGPGHWGWASPRGSPSGQGLQVLPNGPDLRCFPHPFSTATCPRVFLRGLPCCTLTPTSSLAGRGKDPGGLALQFGTHRKFGDRISSSSPHRHAPCTVSPILKCGPEHLAGGLVEQAPAQVPPGPHLPSLPGPQSAAPCMTQKALRSCMLSWTVASGPLSGEVGVCSAWGGGIGSTERTCLGLSSEGGSLGLSALCAQGWEASHPTAAPTTWEHIAGASP